MYIFLVHSHSKMQRGKRFTNGTVKPTVALTYCSHETYIRYKGVETERKKLTCSFSNTIL